ncbi:type II and III secretion system protein family protein [Anaeromyxobacter sp. SG64]|uniref:type II and III secretion system protein family protein n=1 Tax=Anaeromyxobacter sp. SG64 TaxID=2925409 RepID=UPI001F587B98|nr:type II and III secretion system protein family protein [Anaeromyxobacter sp. SG64]
MIPHRARALLASLLVVAGPAAAQDGAQTTPALRIDREMGAAGEMTLEAGQNRLLILSEQIGRIAVANPEVADLKVVTPNQVLLTAKGVGTTDLTLWNRDNQPLVIALQVGRNLEALRTQVKQLFPGETVNITSSGDLVVLSGQVTDVRLPERVAEVARLHAEKVANLIQVSGVQQVQLQVRFAEVARTGLRELGVNFFHKSDDFKTVGGLFSNRTLPGDFLNTAQNPAIPSTGPRGLAGNGFPPDVPSGTFQNAFSVFLSHMGDFPFSVMLNLLEQNNLAKSLAEPTLVALSGQDARFLAGGELPIPIASSFGQTSVEWKRFGIQLQFTPTVIGDAIHLSMKTEVSDIDPSLAVTIAGTSVPGLTSRQSETSIRLADGQSFAIAGLVADRIRSQIAKFPLLGSIPIVGALFRSQAFQRDESELVVVVTAHLVKPVAPHELPRLPTEYEMNDPGDLPFYLLGSQGTSAEVADRRQPPSAERGASGQSGFSQ